MNFKDYYSLFEVVATPVQSQMRPLNLAQAKELITRTAENTFGRIPDAEIGEEENGYNAEITVSTPSRNITFHINPVYPTDYSIPPNVYPSNLTLPNVEIEFSWNWRNEPGNVSPKDSSTTFPVGQEVHPETVPLLKAFREFLIELRKYPILATYTAIESSRAPRNRRASLYEKMFNAVGYIRKNSGLWLSPVLAGGWNTTHPSPTATSRPA